MKVSTENKHFRALEEAALYKYGNGKCSAENTEQVGCSLMEVTVKIETEQEKPSQKCTTCCGLPIGFSIFLILLFMICLGVLVWATKCALSFM